MPESIDRRTAYETRQADQGRRVRSIRIDDKDWELLTFAAKQWGISTGDLVAKSVREYLKSQITKKFLDGC